MWDEARPTSPYNDGGIVIHVEPLQAAFFAGETFTAKITFTNTRPAVAALDHFQRAKDVPERPATVTGASFKQQHKRQAHSITYGSAPLANPPTSPGTPNYNSLYGSSTASLAGSMSARSPTGPTFAVKTPPRKGLIGATGKVNGKPINGLINGHGINGTAVSGISKQIPRRSLSVDVSPLVAGAGPLATTEQPKFGSPRIHPPSPLSRSRVPSVSSQTSASGSTPMSRSTSMPIPKSHPHARKQSVLDGATMNDLIQPHSESNPSTIPSIPSPLSSTAPRSPSLSAFSTGLDPINESAPSGPAKSRVSEITTRDRSSSTPIPPRIAPLHSPKPIKPNEHNELLAGSRARSSSLAHSSGSIGLGHPPPPPSKLGGQVNAPRSISIQDPGPSVKAATSRSAFSSSFSAPNTEVLLWSYAQLLGTVELDEASGLVTPDAAAFLRSKLNVLSGAIGGGRMDIGAPVTPSPLSVGSRTRRGFISSFLGGSSAVPSPISPSSALSYGLGALSSYWNSPAPSPLSPITAASGTPLMVASPMVGVSGGLPATALPTFETQPNMLAVDLNLAPGESRTYTYSVPLPSILPPTFRGKALKFSYHLVIGSSRAASFPVPPTPLPGGGTPHNTNRSKIMRVPIRLYNNVSVERPPIPYDLLWPLARRKAGPVKTLIVEELSDNLAKRLVATKSPTLRGNPENFEEYAKRLLSLSYERPDEATGDEDDTTSVGGTVRGANGKLNGKESIMSPAATLGDLDEELGGTLVGCRENVEILTRVARKMSYDINKDGVKVAVLTFVKTAFRVGETVMGVVEFNDPATRARVLKFSAMLESQEIIPSLLLNEASGPSPLKTRGLRRLHAEHHSSMVIESSRIPFTLDIPSDASPGFRVAFSDGTESGSPGGLEWKVRICLLVAIGTAADDPSRSTRHLIRDGSGGEWGTSWKGTTTLAPLTRGGSNARQYPVNSSASSSGWSLFSSRNVDQASEKDVQGWGECIAETVECEVGITVWPGNTLFRPTQLDFEV